MKSQTPSGRPKADASLREIYFSYLERRANQAASNNLMPKSLVDFGMWLDNGGADEGEPPRQEIFNVVTRFHEETSGPKGYKYLALWVKSGGLDVERRGSGGRGRGGRGRGGRGRGGRGRGRAGRGRGI